MPHLLGRTVVTFCIAFLSLLVLPLPSSAHNGQVTLAAPVTGIAIDGDLSDWPAAIERIPLTYEAYPPSETDRAWFRVGYERTSETIRKACAEDLSADALIDDLIAEVKAFAGEMPQGDDQTVVVLRIGDTESA